MNTVQDLNVNPFASAAYNGLPNGAPPNWQDVGFDYVYDIVLTANQTLLNQTVPIQPDADFLWRATSIGIATGAFSIKYYDSQGYALSNAPRINNSFNVGLISTPAPRFPELIFPAGSRIGIDITDLSGAGNTIQIVFLGPKRYRLPK